MLTRSIRARITESKSKCSSSRVNLEKFNGKNDFNIWKVKIEALLVTQGFRDAIQLVIKKEGKEVSSSKIPE